MCPTRTGAEIPLGGGLEKQGLLAGLAQLLPDRAASVAPCTLNGAPAPVGRRCPNRIRGGPPVRHPTWRISVEKSFQAPQALPPQRLPDRFGSGDLSEGTP